eukprot:2626616-Alexandrium_andersonii.AAC.1
MQSIILGQMIFLAPRVDLVLTLTRVPQKGTAAYANTAGLPPLVPGGVSERAPSSGSMHAQRIHL